MMFDAKNTLQRRAISFWRGVLLATLIVVANEISSLGTNLSLLVFFGALGVFATQRASFTGLKNLGFFACLFGIIFVIRCSFIAIDSSQIFGANSALARLETHADTILFVFSIASLSTWFFWRFGSYPTVEIILLTLGFIGMLAGHRNFNFERPKVINQLAWRLNTEPLIIIILFGTLLLVTSLIYTWVSSSAIRPKEKVFLSYGKQNFFLSFFTLMLLILALSPVPFFMHQVKPESFVEEKTLKFPPGLSRSSQPAAIVRLEGDYKENTYAPMLYLRESAYSKLEGNKLAFAGRGFDSDISDTTPKQAFQGREDAELEMRTPVVQSIYLLTPHENAFSIDYPLSIVQLKNPNPERFKGSYRAYSSAPAFLRSDLNTKEVGDTRWDPEVKKHYLELHPDPRYANLAHEITDSLADPVAKANAIIQYLSLNSIYTLTPNHDTKEGADETAAYLFGDKRGYCIHFAHATVFMLRAVGIPARIGSGYLTDLNQSKDGHILLRVSDRHAWAEAYVRGYGWIPFDTQPEQVENHADTQVDQNLLDELMGMLDPGEEILPEEEKKNESVLDLPKKLPVPSKRMLVLGTVLVLALLGLWKAFLRFGYLLPGNERTKLRRYYTSLASYLWDLGYSRNQGETRREYEVRIGSLIGLDMKAIHSLLLEERYSRHSPQVKIIRSESLQIPVFRKILAAIHIRSLIAFLMRPGW